MDNPSDLRKEFKKETGKEFVIKNDGFELPSWDYVRWLEEQLSYFLE